MEYPYECEIDIVFPTALHALQTMKVMQVDKEIGDRVIKTFELVGHCQTNADDQKMLKNDNDEQKNGGPIDSSQEQNETKHSDSGENIKNVLKVRFRATEAKMLRVSVSSFYDYLTVALKCYQEFDTSLRNDK